MLVPIFYIDSIENFSITFNFIHKISIVLSIYLKNLLFTI